ncbi:MAG: hypothetical protein C4K47_01995 [Candidatus Thorarchaeota archaeon]|nr:MAG: hypothetical protein C4K47_01995 [Candidatus Thorarchaeota archaeon]
MTKLGASDVGFVPAHALRGQYPSGRGSKAGRLNRTPATISSSCPTAGYIQIEKKFVERKPLTVIHLTEAGRAAFRIYQQKMKHMFEGREAK